MDEDPVAAWQVHCDGVQAVLDDPETAHRELANPHMGRLPLETAIDQFYTADRAVGRKPCPSGGVSPACAGPQAAVPAGAPPGNAGDTR